MDKNKLVHYFIIGIFVSLYFLVATISMINSVAFFDLSHSGLMNWALAIGFELGAAASLAAIVILDKTNKTMVWGLFLLLTSFQMMANSFHAFINLENYMGWIELFGLAEAEPIYQKRVLSIVSGAILPLVALGFIKSLVDYIRPEEKNNIEESIPEEAKAWKGAFDIDTSEIETPVAGSAEPVIEKEIIPEASEEAVEEDLYSRDADKAKIPAEIGEVHIAPETVKPENVVVDVVEKPISTEHITPVGDPIVIPTPETQPNIPKKAPLTSRPFIRNEVKP
ncbi:MAG: hypothetical protein H8E16_12785 [Flavobacteriales bacterium]|nr:hypothetical protein [Flavobacteriales bacterium]